MGLHPRFCTEFQHFLWIFSIIVYNIVVTFGGAF